MDILVHFLLFRLDFFDLFLVGNEVFSDTLHAGVFSHDCRVWSVIALFAVTAGDWYGRTFILPVVVQFLNCLKVNSTAITVSLGYTFFQNMFLELLKSVDLTFELGLWLLH